MQTTHFKELISALPEDQQETLARFALKDLEKRTKILGIAKGSIWIKLGWLIPVILMSSFFYLKNGPDYLAVLPIILLFLAFWIQIQAQAVHARIDAIVELLKLDRPLSEPEASGDALRK